MNKVRKSILAMLLFAVIISGATVFSWHSKLSANAEPNSVVTREEVNTLEKLRATPVEEIAAWNKYDSRDYGIVTSVKYQGSTNLCWVYGSLAAMETNILRQGFSGKTNESLDLDEREFAKASKGKWDDPLDNADGTDNRKSDSVLSTTWDREGAISMVTQFAARGQGVYEESEDIGTEPQERYSSYWLRNAITCDNKVEEIKKLIAEYGSVAFTYHSGLMDYTYLYARGTNDHASVIIGWDDTIDRNKFQNSSRTKPEQDGGWIVKNSYGTGSFENGYCYLSYESDLFELTAFEMAPSEEYDWYYNYSDSVYESASYNTYQPTDAENAEYVAIYKAKKGDIEEELLKGVSIGVAGKNVQISILIYADVDEAATSFGSATFAPKSGKLVAEATYHAPSTGIYTIPITSRVELEKDCYFTILVKLSGGNIISDRFAYRSSTMTYVWDAGKWNRLSSPFPPFDMSVLCIKALTVTKAEDEVFDISEGVLSLSCDSYVYTGLPHCPEVTVKLDDTAISSDCYTVSYENNINTGTATVKVEGIGNYIGYLQTTFKIVKAIRADFKVELGDWTYGQTAMFPSVSNYGLEEGSVTYTYGTTAFGPFEAVIPQKAGSYFVQAEMTETDNYEKAIAVSQFSILKAAAPELPEELNELHVTEEMKVLSDIRLPANWIWQTPDAPLVAGVMQVYVVYAGEDSESFETTVFQVELKVPEPEDTEEPGGEEKPPVVEPDDPDDKEPESGNGDDTEPNEPAEPGSGDDTEPNEPAEPGNGDDTEPNEPAEPGNGDDTEPNEPAEPGNGDDTEPNEPTEPGNGENSGGEDIPDKDDGGTETDRPNNSETPSENPPGGGNPPADGGGSIGMWIGISVGALAIVVLGGIIFIVLRRNKKK